MSLLMFGTFFGADLSKKNLLNFRKEYVEVKFYLIKSCFILLKLSSIYDE